MDNLNLGFLRNLRQASDEDLRALIGDVHDGIAFYKFCVYVADCAICLKCLSAEEPVRRKRKRYCSECGARVKGQGFRLVPHLGMCQFLCRPSEKQWKMMVVPRHCYKSRMARLYSAWRILHDPDIVVLFDGETAKHAGRSLRYVKQLFESEKFKRIYGDWTGADDPDHMGWKEDRITVAKRTRVMDAPTVLVGGIDSALAGLHPDIAMEDDLTGNTNWKTEDGRERAWHRVQELVPLIAGTGEAIFFDTIWHLDDHTSRILRNEELLSQFDVMVRSAADSHGGLLKPDAQPSNRVYYDMARRKLGWTEERLEAEGQWFFPEMVGPKFVDGALKTATKGFVSRHYFNNPIVEEEAIGRPAGYFHDSPPGRIVAAVDLAKGAEFSVSNTGFVVMKMSAPENPEEYYGNFYVLEAYERNWDFARNLSEIFALVMKYRQLGLLKVIVERAGQDTSTDSIRMEMRRRNCYFVLDDPPASPGHSKDDRIRASLKVHYENGRVYHHESLRNGAYEAQLLNFGATEKKDIADAAARAAMALLPPVPIAIPDRSRYRMVAGDVDIWLRNERVPSHNPGLSDRRFRRFAAN